MTPEEIDDLIRDAASTYNTPPAPPRELMWEAISRARAEAAVVPIRAVRRWPKGLASAARIAAVLLIGVLIGRVSFSREKQPAVASVQLQSDDASISKAIEPQVEMSPEQVAEAGSNGVDIPGVVTRGPARPGRIAGAVRRRRAPNDFSGDDAAYRLAVLQHLTRTEVVLTSFRSQALAQGSAKVDAQFASLTRDLLSTTRLMIATHRNDDQTMTRLLEDLELVLMQISQYASDGRRIDLDAATQSIDKRNVILKLRSTIPAGT